MAPASSLGCRARHPCLLPPRPHTSSVPFPMAVWRPLLHHRGVLGHSFWPSRLGAAPPRPGPISHLAPGLVCCWAVGRPPTRPWGGDRCSAVPSRTWVQILVATSGLCAVPHPCPGPCFLCCERGFLTATSWGLAEDRADRGDPKLLAQHLEVVCAQRVLPAPPHPHPGRPGPLKPGALLLPVDAPPLAPAPELDPGERSGQGPADLL